MLKILAVATVAAVVIYEGYQVAKNAQPYIKEDIEQSINTTMVVASVATKAVTYEIEKHKTKDEEKSKESRWRERT